MRPNSKPAQGPPRVGLALALAVCAAALAEAVLVQRHNYMLDDSSLVGQHELAGSLSPFYNDQGGASEHAADKDIASIIGDSLARLRLARMLEQEGQDEQAAGQLSPEMAELIQEGQQQAADGKQAAGEQSLSSSVASMLMSAAQAVAAQSEERAEAQQQQQRERPGASQQPSGGPIMELDTSQAAQPSKADLKAGPSQWFNPKETIPVLKISSMATPSKYKKVYFRSEKKLVDGAFHSPASEHEEKKPALAAKPLSSAVQRRSSRGSSVPPGVLQDGVIDFLKKFRDVYVQTRPAGASASPGSSLAANLAAAASSPFAAILAPASSGARPNLASALSTASQMVNSAAMLSQAAAAPAASTTGSAAPPASPGAATAAAAAAAGAATSAAAAPGKSPLNAQTYVSFWSKTFPTWVRKMLKQMRRRSLYNSSRRQQAQQAQQHAHGIGQKAAGGNPVSGVAPDAAALPASSSGSS